MCAWNPGRVCGALSIYETVWRGHVGCTSLGTLLLLSMKAVYIVIIAYPLHFLLLCQVCGVVFSLSIISKIGIWKNTYSTTQPVTTEIK